MERDNGHQEVLTSVNVQGNGLRSWTRGPPGPSGARISVQSAGSAAVVRIAEMPLAHATVQPLPGDRFLVVAARCRWRPEGPDRNALVYGPDGAVLAEYTFGDGIEDVLTTPSDNAWVGYFDEGVYGNYGWAVPGPEPTGSCGLGQFGPGGELVVCAVLDG